MRKKIYNVALWLWSILYLCDNEKDWMGDRKRKLMKSTFPKAKFELKYSVLNVNIGYDHWAAIIERLIENVRDKYEEEIKKRSKNIAR